MNISLNMTGKSFSSQLDIIQKKMLATSQKAVVKVGIELLDLAIQECPIDTGALRKSGLVKLNGQIIAKGSKKNVIASYNINLQDGKFEVEVSFNTPYALRQHEVLSYVHKVGKAKYLEDPLKNNITRFMDIIINETQKELKK